MFLEAEFIDSNYAVKHTKEINFFSKFFHSQEIKEYDLLICPEKLNKRANEYFKNQEYEKAIIYYQHAIENFNNIHHFIHYEASKLHLTYGEYLLSINNIANAKIQLNKAIFQDHNNLDAIYLLKTLTTNQFKITYDKNFTYLFDFYHFLYWQINFANLNFIIDEEKKIVEKSLLTTSKKVTNIYMQYGHKNYDKTIEAMNKYCYNNEYLIEICYHRKIPRKINLPENNWVDKFSKQPLLMMDIIMNIIIHNNEIISKLNLVQLLDEINYEHFRYYYIKYLLNRKEVFLEKAINLHSEMHHYYHETAAMLYFNLALAYAAVEDYDNMLGACYKILDLNQNLEELWEILVRYFIFIKLYTKALDYSEKSVNINNISEDFLIRQKLYQKVILEFLV